MHRKGTAIKLFDVTIILKVIRHFVSVIFEYTYQ